jgi:hypothetical protein
VPVRSGLHAVEHHPRQRRHLMHLTGREDDRVAGSELALDMAVSKEAVAFYDVIDLVGARDGSESATSAPAPSTRC